MFAAGRQAEFPSDGNSCSRGVSLWSTQVEVRVEFSFSRQHFWNIKMTCVCCLFKEKKKKTERGVFPFRFSFSYRRLQVEFSSSIWWYWYVSWFPPFLIFLSIKSQSYLKKKKQKKSYFFLHFCTSSNFFCAFFFSFSLLICKEGNWKYNNGSFSKWLYKNNNF